MFKKCFKIVFFSLWQSTIHPVLELAISDAVVRSSVVFCNSVSADRIVMAASRLLRAVAAFVILLSFAAGSRKSSWSGCMKAATMICWPDSLIPFPISWTTSDYFCSVHDRRKKLFQQCDHVPW